MLYWHIRPNLRVITDKLSSLDAGYIDGWRVRTAKGNGTGRSRFDAHLLQPPPNEDADDGSLAQRPARLQALKAFDQYQALTIPV